MWPGGTCSYWRRQVFWPRSQMREVKNMSNTISRNISKKCLKKPGVRPRISHKRFLFWLHGGGFLAQSAEVLLGWPGWVWTKGWTGAELRSFGGLSLSLSLCLLGSKQREEDPRALLLDISMITFLVGSDCWRWTLWPGSWYTCGALRHALGLSPPIHRLEQWEVVPLFCWWGSGDER